MQVENPGNQENHVNLNEQVLADVPKIDTEHIQIIIKHKNKVDYENEIYRVYLGKNQDKIQDKKILNIMQICEFKKLIL